MTVSPAPPSLPPFAQDMARMIVANPFCRALGMELVALVPGKVTVKVPYRPVIAGDGAGVIASGVVTTLLDNVSGAAAGLALDKPAFVATINLRLDYMRAAKPGFDIIGEAESYKITRNVVFVRGAAFEDDRDDPVAHCVAAFMINPIPENLLAGMR